MTAYIYNDLFLEHETGQHPENSNRLRSINQTLEASDLSDKLTRHAPRPATESEVALVHDAGYVASVNDACKRDVGNLDADTAVSVESYNAAMLSAGAGITAVDLVMAQTEENAFCAVRPPGHHAEHNRAMGFCLFNNVAVAARYAQEHHKLERVVIFDWDVHHGNGTQHSFYSDPSILYSSTHQYPFYPGTGGQEETGTGDGLGATLNFPLRAYSGDEDYLGIVENRLLPELYRFKPELIIISAGFDAHADDPLGQMNLSSECYGAMTAKIKAAARELCDGRMISMLEGGYNLEALADSVISHLTEMSK